MAVGVRSLLAVFGPGSFYYSDSWCYVKVTAYGPCDSGHSQAITWIWRIGTFGDLTERNVLIFQSVLGVMSALLLFRALRLLTTATWAMVGASLFTIIPMELLFERSLLVESTESFFVCLFLATAAESFRSTTVVRMVAFSIAASASLGAAAAVHDEFLFSALIVWFFMVALQFWLASHICAGRTQKLSVAGAAVLSLAILILPNVPVAIDDQNWYGSWAADPIDGANLTLDWSPLVSCATPPDATDGTRIVLHVACAHREFETPGNLVLLSYAPTVASAIGLAAGKQRFAETEQQLLGIALKGITDHPVAFSREMVSGVVWQLFRPPIDFFSSYANAWVSGSASSIFTPANLPSFSNYHQWFSGPVIRSNSPAGPGLRRIVSATLRLPQLLLWLAIVGGLCRASVWLFFSRKKLGHDARGSRGWKALIATPFSLRVCLGLLGSLVIATSMVAVAFGSVPDIRYWMPLIPCIIVLAVLVVPLAESGTAHAG